MNKLFFLALGSIVLLGCRENLETRFKLLSAQQTGIDFANDLEETPQFNIFSYLYFYNGGGVGAGDLNGDGLPDLYFTSNLSENRLYINQGNLQFLDATEKAGVKGKRGWTTGVSLADVNGDGKLDIYVSQLGDYQHIVGRNQLYINLGNDENSIPRFEDQAGKYGLDLKGFSTQAAFLDYDLDGDLDMYMLNHSVHAMGTFVRAKARTEKHPLAGDKLMRNDQGKFVDVTSESGIYSSVLGYGLGITIGDINMDGFPDIYVGNDFHENDYLYLNNGDGTFRETLEESMGHTSRFSMGNDIGDFNNDGWPDIFSLDMLPQDPVMLKRSAAEDPYDIYHQKLGFGYNNQFARNTLQLNLGNDKFSEIGLLTGVYATDWSWATLMVDLDLDGRKDIFISNGIKRRSNDMDYIKYMSNEAIQQKVSGDLTEKDLDLIELMPEVKIPNFVFRNDGKLHFSNVSEEWGLNQESFSNGAVYADLDDDGDLDLIVNNIDDPAFIFENKTRQLASNQNNYLKIKFAGEAANLNGIGSKIIIPRGDELIVYEQFPTRGFQSSVDLDLIVGLGPEKVIEKLIVIWPDNSFQEFDQVTTNQTLTVSQKDAGGRYDYSRPVVGVFSDYTDSIRVEYKHNENRFIEFNVDRLMPHMVSTEGPKLAVGDIDNDGNQDFYVGGALHQRGGLFVQGDSGFRELAVPDLKADSASEDIGAVFVDVDGDEDLDLIVVSGGNEFGIESPNSRPRLYINDGQGKLTRVKDQLPDVGLTGSCVCPADIDNDGDMDLFIGARAVPRRYGFIPQSYLFENDGLGRFRDISGDAFKKPTIGMVKDATWADLNQDGFQDLIVVGEWMPIKIYLNTGSRLELMPEGGLSRSNGWWNTVIAEDFDRDGDIDIFAGNLGENSKLRASEDEPLCMYVNDFDQNGTLDQLLCHFVDGEEKLFPTKDEITEQLVVVKKKFVKYSEFANAELEDVVDKSALDNALRRYAFELRSGIFVNDGQMNFNFHPLPTEAQFAPINAAYLIDYDHDGFKDIFAGGNFFEVNIQRGRYDASYGLLLKNSGNGDFQYVPERNAGLKIKGQIRDIKPINYKGQVLFMVARNSDQIVFVRKE